MLPEGLESYLAACRTQGASDEAIRQALLLAGWPAELVAQVLPPISQPRRSFWRRLGRWLVLGLGIFLVVSGVLIAFAEQGYLPAVSRIYRRTPLPLLWGGTTGQLAQGLSKALAESNSQPLYSLTMSDEIAVNKINAAGSINLSRSNLLAPLAFLTPSSSALASYPSGSSGTSVQPLFDINQILPLDLKFDSSFSSDLNYSSRGNYLMDLSSLDKAFHPAETATAASQIKAEAKLITNQDQLYLRTNLLPALNPANRNKWLKITIPEKDMEIWKKPDKITETLTEQQKKDLASLALALGRDEGISREDGQPYAHYRVYIDQAGWQKLINTPILSDYKEMFQSLITDSAPVVDIEITLSARSGQLHAMTLKLTSNDPKANYSLEISSGITVAYQPSPTVLAPAKSEIIDQDPTKYAEDALTAVSQAWTAGQPIDDPQWFGNSKVGLGVLDLLWGGGSAPTAEESTVVQIKAANATRRSDLNELGRGMESYLNDYPDVAPPSTNNQVQSVDDPNGAIIRDATLAKTVSSYLQFNASTQKYHYTYQSDGIHYQFSVLLDDPETGKPYQQYIIKDGTSGVLPYPVSQ